MIKGKKKRSRRTVLSHLVTMALSCSMISYVEAQQKQQRELKFLTKEETVMSKVAVQLAEDVYYGTENGEEVNEHQINFWLHDVDAVLTAKYKKQYCFASFRGTTGSKFGKDWFQNYHGKKKKLKGTKCDSTRGWLKAYRFKHRLNVIEDITECKTNCPSCKVVFTGHSQGGAVAAIAAVKLSNFDPYVVLFGAPGAISDECSQYIDSNRWFHFIQAIPSHKGLKYDIVPIELFGKLFGHEIYLSNKDDVNAVYTGKDNHVDNAPHSFKAHDKKTYRNTLNSFGEVVDLCGFTGGLACTEDWECRSNACTYDEESTTYKCEEGGESCLDWYQIGADIKEGAVDKYLFESLSLSANGSYMVVGAFKNNSGHARIYHYNSQENEWKKVWGDIDGDASSAFLGRSVSISKSGERVAIGGYYDAHKNVSGRTRIFAYSQEKETWTQIGSDIEGDTMNIWSTAQSVSISGDGDKVAIGSPNNHGIDGGAVMGQVRIYKFSSKKNDWTQLGGDIIGEANGDFSGSSVSISGDGSRVAIGAPFNDGNGDTSGHVRVYGYSNTVKEWIQLGSDLDGEAMLDRSGSSVALSEDGYRVAIGAPWNTSSNRGHVRVYKYSIEKAQWEQLGLDIDGKDEYDYSGYSVSLSADGNRVAIGSYWNDGEGDERGHVRVFDYSSIEAKWNQVGYDIKGKKDFEESGRAVSISADGKRVAIGSFGGSYDYKVKRRVRIFEFVG